MMKRISVEIDGRKVEGWAEKVGSTLWLQIGDRTVCYEPPKKEGRRSARGAKTKTVGDVVAPMPGKINKISVQSGEAVDLHQVVVVMEAMKMEYTLKAQAEGVIAAVNCKVGDQVALGQLLVKIAPRNS